MLDAHSADEAWALAKAQVPVIGAYAPPSGNGCSHKPAPTSKPATGGAEPLLVPAARGEPHELRDQLADRAVALRKKKQYPAALIYLRLLGRDPACGETIRFEMAACGLKGSSHDLSAEARAADPCLQQFARLIHSHETDPAVYVKQAKWLEPDDLFYLGFHFVEGKGAEREFGARCYGWRWSARRVPRWARTPRASCAARH